MFSLFIRVSLYHKCHEELNMWIVGVEHISLFPFLPVSSLLKQFLHFLDDSADGAVELHREPQRSWPESLLHKAAASCCFHWRQTYIPSQMFVR